MKFIFKIISKLYNYNIKCVINKYLITVKNLGINSSINIIKEVLIEEKEKK